MSVLRCFSKVRSTAQRTLFALGLLLATQSAEAKNFNTGFVLNDMQDDEANMLIDGVVRGIAYAHYFQNNKDNKGFDCIMGYAHGSGTAEKIHSLHVFFENYLDKPLGGVAYVYLRKKCNL